MKYPFSGEYYGQIASHEDDLSFWQKIFVSRPKNVLELGIGTGRLALKLCDLCENYHGIDFEPSMLKIVREKAQAQGKKIFLHEGTFIDFSIKSAFDLIFIPANTISHVLNFDQARLFFNGIKHHIKDKGVFIIDTFYPQPQPAHKERYLFKKYHDHESGQEVSIYSTQTYCYETQTITHSLEYLKKTTVFQKYDLKQRAYYPAELATWLRWVGFSTIVFHGNYDFSELKEGSKRLIIKAS